MGSPSAVAEPPADLEQKRREAAGEGEQGDGELQQPEGEAGEQAPPSGEGETGEGNAAAGEGEGEFPGEGEGEEGPPPIIIEGDGQLNLQVGGRKPDKATVKLRGGSINIPAGQLKKGDVLNLLVKVQVAEVHLVDKIDNTTGEITEVERRHVAKIKGVEKVTV